MFMNLDDTFVLSGLAAGVLQLIWEDVFVISIIHLTSQERWAAALIKGEFNKLIGRRVMVSFKTSVKTAVVELLQALIQMDHLEKTGNYSLYFTTNMPIY